jgi:hypothetical protein
MELIEGILGLILDGLEIFLREREDFKNRNDRGLFRQPSNKYIC